MQTNSYLFFPGSCEQALEYYQQHLGAKVTMLMRFSDSPEPMPEGMLPPNYDDKVMHCEFTLGNASVFASDGCGDNASFSGFSQALTVKDEQEAHRIFNALADGGKVVMPLTPTFWSPLYGQVTDQFGLAWMVMVEGPEQP